MCDSSQGGTVMQCPTCFQQIVAPQASTNAKFILTGQKYVERKAAGPADAGVGTKPQSRKMNPIVVGVIIAAVLAAAGVFYFVTMVGWQSRDIGDVGVAGSFQRAAGTFAVSGGGADIWNQADAFRYVYQTLKGDATLTARVVSVQNTDPWSKAGLMIRESLNADAANVMALVSSSSGALLEQRDHTGNTASALQMVPNLSAPCWLRLTRRGNVFTAYSSADGKNWANIGTTTVPMNNPVLAGLAVTSHKAGTLCQVKFDNVSLETP